MADVIGNLVLLAVIVAAVFFVLRQLELSPVIAFVCNAVLVVAAVRALILIVLRR